ncbi:hypothetical protein [Sphingomonas phage Birtae]|nr:hypothetical protein [Sphingomonas phage Birtae]
MSLRLPSESELNEVAELIAGKGVTYDRLSPENRALIVKIAIQADISDTLAAMLDDTGKVADWFKHSKLWEGRID